MKDKREFYNSLKNALEELVELKKKKNKSLIVDPTKAGQCNRNCGNKNNIMCLMVGCKKSNT